MTNIFIIYCNPKEDSFSESLAKTYELSAQKAGHNCNILNVYDLDMGYLDCKGREFDTSLSIELKEAQKKMVDANKIVFIYPVWAGTMPAKLKSFLEQVLQDGVFIKIQPDGRPVPLLKQKEAIVIQTYSMPVIMMKLLAKDLSFKALKSILDLINIKVEKRFDFGMMELSDEEKRRKWLKKIADYAFKN